MKKHFLIYKITNLINDKIYVGMHGTDNIDDGYMGSGYLIKEAISKYGEENFKKEYLFDFDNEEDMIKKEEELVTDEFVKRNDTYNLREGGYGWRSGHQNNKGKVVARDSNGDCLQVNVDDPRYVSGELIPLNKGFANVVDKDNNKYRVPKDDPRIKSGELFSHTKGVSRTFSKTHIENLKKANSREGKNDWKIGKKCINDGQKTIVVDADEYENYLSNGYDCGMIKGETVWVNNGDTNKRIVKEDIGNYINNGWVMGHTNDGGWDKRRANSKQKPFTITSPDGVVYENIWSLRNFCQDNQLSEYTFKKHINKGPVGKPKRNISDKVNRSTGWEIKR